MLKNLALNLLIALIVLMLIQVIIGFIIKIYMWHSTAMLIWQIQNMIRLLIIGC